MRKLLAKEAVRAVSSRHNVYVQGMAATPSHLTEAMTRWGVKEGLQDVSVYHMHTEGNCFYADPAAVGSFTCKTFFAAANVRKAIAEKRAQYLPCFMGDIPRLIRNRVIPVNVALVHTSTPDENGYCSLGVSVEGSLAAIEKADHVICQMNRQMPHTYGQSLVHMTKFDSIVEHDTPIYTTGLKDPKPEDSVIGELIAYNLVPDGATIQLGIGNIPNMVLSHLGGHKDLGVHSEMFSDGIIPLVEKGVITNSKKTLDPGKLVATFLIGTDRLFQFVHKNPMVEMKDVAYTNDPGIIRQHEKMTSINSAIEVDITGQVCSDSIGPRIYSGFGGQVDFVRGSTLSHNGKSIIALHSRTSDNTPRIVPCIHSGAGIVTTRAHVNYVVTEYGIACLEGKTINERAKQMISIAHPDDRALLTEHAMCCGLI